VFAELNGYPLAVRGWYRTQLGPMLRGEARRRIYFSYFELDLRVLVESQVARLFEKVREPPIRRLPPVVSPVQFVFTEPTHHSDVFADLREHRDFLRARLLAMIKPQQLAILERQERPVLGVHIRMGDYKPLAPGADFKALGHTRTPLSYFRDLVLGIRQVAGKNLPMTIFTDGHRSELAEILALPDVRLFTTGSDLVDLLLLSRSGLIIVSAGSSFSYWAGFLSDAPVLLHPDHLYKPHRTQAVNERLFEGGVGPDPSSWPPLLLDNIRELAASQSA
jgi:hypothetical protein